MWRSKWAVFCDESGNIQWDVVRSVSKKVLVKQRHNIKNKNKDGGTRQIAYAKNQDEFWDYLRSLNLEHLNTHAHITKILFSNPQGKLREYAAAKLIHENVLSEDAASIKDAVEQNIFDAILVQPIENDEPIILFKKLGRGIFELEVYPGEDPFAILFQGCWYWKGGYDLPEEFEGFDDNAIELPLKLFTDERLAPGNTAIIKKVKTSLRRIGIGAKKSGGNRQKKDDQHLISMLDKKVYGICEKHIMKKGSIPTIEQAAKEVAKNRQLEEYSNATIKRSMDRAIPRIIAEAVSDLCSYSSTLQLKKRTGKTQPAGKLVLGKPSSAIH